jgi:hypothetical protein
LDAHAASLLDALKERERAHLAQAQHMQQLIRAQLIHFEPLHLPAKPASYPNAPHTTPYASHTLSNATPVQDYKDTTNQEDEMYHHKKGKAEAVVLQSVWGGPRSESAGVLPIPTLVEATASARASRWRDSLDLQDLDAKKTVQSVN